MGVFLIFRERSYDQEPGPSVREEKPSAAELHNKLFRGRVFSYFAQITCV